MFIVDNLESLTKKIKITHYFITQSCYNFTEFLFHIFSVHFHSVSQPVVCSGLYLASVP